MACLWQDHEFGIRNSFVEMANMLPVENIVITPGKQKLYR